QPGSYARVKEPGRRRIDVHVRQPIGRIAAIGNRDCETSSAENPDDDEPDARAEHRGEQGRHEAKHEQGEGDLAVLRVDALLCDLATGAARDRYPVEKNTEHSERTPESGNSARDHWHGSLTTRPLPDS